MAYNNTRLLLLDSDWAEFRWVMIAISGVKNEIENVSSFSVNKKPEMAPMKMNFNYFEMFSVEWRGREGAFDGALFHSNGY